MREAKAKAGMPVWRRDDDGNGFALKLTAAGLKAIAIEDDRGPAGEPCETLMIEPDQIAAHRRSDRRRGLERAPARAASSAWCSVYFSDPRARRSNS